MEEAKTKESTGSWRPKFQSEYSMGSHDFERYNQTLIKIDELSAIVNSTASPPLELMADFLSQLQNLYDNFRALISVGTLQKEYEKLFKEGIDLKRQWEQSKRSGTPFSKKKLFIFIDLCRNIKTKLYSTKQVIGLGIVVRKNMTTTQRIKKGIRGDSSFGNLPEA